MISLKTLSLTVLVLVFSVLPYPTASEDRAAGTKPTGRLGIEITTNTNDKPLYIPVALTSEKSMVAYIPIRNGEDVSAVKVEPRMEDGKVRFNASTVSGAYEANGSCADVRKLPTRLIGIHYASNGETVTVRDNLTALPWSVHVKAVNLRPPMIVGGNPTVLKRFSAFQEEIDLVGGPGGCASCSRKDPLLCCPARGKCMECSDCGTVCCPNGD